MIKIILGGVGSGKSITAIKDIIKTETNGKSLIFTNFNVRKKGIFRLKESHIIKNFGSEKKPDYKVNFEFWNDLIKKGIKFDIYIDEAHNIINARRSMSKWNILFNKWFTQIRKILGDMKEHHLIVISQRKNAIDLTVRDLAQEIIFCLKKEFKPINTEIEPNKFKLCPKTYIFLFHFEGMRMSQDFELFLMGSKTYSKITYFLANPFFKYYNSFQLLNFGEGSFI